MQNLSFFSCRAIRGNLCSWKKSLQGTNYYLHQKQERNNRMIYEYPRGEEIVSLRKSGVETSRSGVAISCIVREKENDTRERRGMGERKKKLVGKKKSEGRGGIALRERRLCKTVANKWPAITCNLPYIQTPWPPSRQ